jgi:hypothetical protein
MHTAAQRSTTLLFAENNIELAKRQGNSEIIRENLEIDLTLFDGRFLHFAMRSIASVEMTGG